jgi:hypothetical protein
VEVDDSGSCGVAPLNHRLIAVKHLDLGYLQGRWRMEWFQAESKDRIQLKVIPSLFFFPLPFFCLPAS